MIRHVITATTLLFLLMSGAGAQDGRFTNRDCAIYPMRVATFGAEASFTAEVRPGGYCAFSMRTNGPFAFDGVSVVSQPRNGWVTSLNRSAFSYTANTRAEGSDAFVVVVRRDFGGRIEPLTVSVEIIVRR
jgi:hypothetical protein